MHFNLTFHYIPLYSDYLTTVDRIHELDVCISKVIPLAHLGIPTFNLGKHDLSTVGTVWVVVHDTVVVVGYPIGISLTFGFFLNTVWSS